MPPRIATPGQLRERVEFQRRGVANDGYGNTRTNVWSLLWACSARITPQRGSESVDAEALVGFQPVTIIVRMCDALRHLIPDDRVMDVRKGTIYDIQSLANFDEHGQFLEIAAISSGHFAAGASPPATILSDDDRAVLADDDGASLTEAA